MTATDGERTRVRHIIDRMRAQLDAVALGLPHPPCTESAQAVLQAAGELVAACARLDVHDRAERGESKP